MPEFVMIGNREPAFLALDDFTQGYIEALFFTDNAPGVTTEEWQATEDHREGSFPGDAGFADLAPEALVAIVADCKRFQERHALVLAEAYAREDYESEQAGRDFWYTRNGHGVGFWEREQLKGEVDLGESLTLTANAYRETDSYLGDDGKVYLS